MGEWIVKLHRAAETVESWAGAFMATAIGCLLATIAMIEFDPQLNLNGPQFFFVTFGLFLAVEAPLLWRLWSAIIRGEQPLGPVVASRKIYRSRPMRALGAAWWGLHFLLGVAAIAATHHVPNANMPLAVAVFLGFAANVASNVFLALCVKALTNSDRAVARVWEARFPIDLGLAVIVAALFWFTP